MGLKRKVSKAFKDKAGVPRANLVHFQATQLKFGFIEIEEKQKRFQDMTAKGTLEDYLRKSPVLVVLGPPGIKDTRPYPSIVEVAGQIETWSQERNKDTEAVDKLSAEKTGETKYAGNTATIFVIDRHHQSLALLLNGAKTAPIEVVHDFSDLTVEEFWQKMKDKNLLYPNPDHGEPDSFNDIYRSLAWYVRKAGGFEKVAVPYAEFHWADYFRERMDLKFVTESFEAAIKEALVLAKSADARELPGYIVPQQRSDFKACRKTAERIQSSLKPD